jgi:hypothetical protein
VYWIVYPLISRIFMYSVTSATRAAGMR